MDNKCVVLDCKSGYAACTEKLSLFSFPLHKPDLNEHWDISSDIVLMVDEMYLQKGTQFHGGECIGAVEDGNLYKGIVVLMIAGLKKPIPYAIKACP